MRCRAIRPHQSIPFALIGCALLVAVARAGQPDPALADLESEVFALVNGHRVSLGLPELTYDATLAELARSHSRAMATREVGLGHAGFDRRKRAVNDHVVYSAIGENVFRSTRSRSEVPEAALRVWLGSRGHRRKIEGDYELSGLGIAVAPDGTYYFTQLFVAKRR